MGTSKTASKGPKKKQTSTKRTSSTPSQAAKAGAKPGASSAEVTMDRRGGADRRSGEDRRKKNEPVAVERRTIQRRAKVNRRRQIDPTTCERDYTADEIEFMTALENYKRTSGRMFPTCSEILEVLRGLGYEKRPVAQPDQSAGEEPEQARSAETGAEEGSDSQRPPAAPRDPSATPPAPPTAQTG